MVVWEGERGDWNNPPPPPLRGCGTWSSHLVLVDTQGVPGMNGCALREDRKVEGGGTGSPLAALEIKWLLG